MRRFTVLLSHWHLDHVAGTEVFDDCEVIASARTAEHLTGSRTAIESGDLEGPPPINPLILPTRTLEEDLELEIGETEVRLFTTEIHSDDATLIWLPAERLLLCGDTMEDTVTYVDEPERLDVHTDNLNGLRDLEPLRILPNHGDPKVISTGGYGAGLIDDTVSYIGALQRCRTDPALRSLSLRDFIADVTEMGTLNYFEPYEDVHRGNVEKVLAAG